LRELTAVFSQSFGSARADDTQSAAATISVLFM
jgi:hypothetical protein